MCANRANGMSNFGDRLLGRQNSERIVQKAKRDFHSPSSSSPSSSPCRKIDIYTHQSSYGSMELLSLYTVRWSRRVRSMTKSRLAIIQLRGEASGTKVVRCKKIPAISKSFVQTTEGSSYFHFD